MAEALSMQRMVSRAKAPYVLTRTVVAELLNWLVQTLAAVSVNVNTPAVAYASLTCRPAAVWLPSPEHESQSVSTGRPNPMAVKRIARLL